MKLIIQIPCYNEETTLPEVIRDLPRVLPGIDEIEYLVIDDGSIDNTVNVARSLGVHHIHSLGNNKGLSTAFKEGIDKCLDLGADIIVNTDGDNQYDAGYIKDLVAPIIEGRMDIVIGTRPLDEIENYSKVKNLLQRLGSRVVRHFSGTDIPDTTSGFRAYSAEAALRLQVFNKYTYTLETIIQSGHMNMRIGHVPIQVNGKMRESRLISSIPSYIWQSGLIILRSYITYKPLRTFFYCAILPALVGLAICLRFMYYYLFDSGSGHIQSLILAAILLIISFLMIMLGILADLISTNRRLIQESIFVQRKQIYDSRKSKCENNDISKHQYSEFSMTGQPSFKRANQAN